jgi:hypothetical protein
VNTVSATVVTYSANLVTGNGGFEGDATTYPTNTPPAAPPAGWSLWRADGTGRCGVIDYPDCGYGEGNYKSVKVAGVNQIAYEYDINVSAGEKYVAEAVFRQLGQGTVTLCIYWKNSDGSWFRPMVGTIANPVPFDGTWRKAIARVTVPAGVAKLTVMCLVTGQASETNDIVWFDNVSLKKITESANPFCKLNNYILPYSTAEQSGSEYGKYSTAGEVVNTLRMGVLQYSTITPAAADTAIKALRREGFNAILGEGQRYLFNDSEDPNSLPDALKGSLHYSELVSNTTTFVTACHNNGLKAYLHLTATAVSDAFAAAHPDWMTKSFNDGQTTRIWGMLFACLHNTGFWNAYSARLSGLISASGADGLMVDETCTMYDLCGCNTCRGYFNVDTGYTIPAQGAPWQGDLTNSIYKAFLPWRPTKAQQAGQSIKNVLTLYKPDGVDLSYYACPFYEKALADHGCSVDMLDYCWDSQGWEAIQHYTVSPEYTLLTPKPVTWCWPVFTANLKLTRAVSERKLGSLYYINCPGSIEERYLNWVMGLSQGAHQYWDRYNSTPYTAPYARWEMKHENFLAGLTSSADVAVFCSTRNNNLISSPSGYINRQNSFFAICNTLALAHIPYKVIVDNDIDANLFSKAKVVIMMNVGLMSDTQAGFITQFVNSGGTLIASAETSLYDENGIKRSNFALSSIFGCNYGSLITKRGCWLDITNGNSILGNFTGWVNLPDDFLSVTATTGINLGFLRDYNAVDQLQYVDRPSGVILNTYGSGKAIYFAGHPETSLYTYRVLDGMNIMDRDAFGAQRDSGPAGMAQLFCNIVNNANAAASTAPVTNLPSGVTVETYAHNYKGAQGVQVHLVNLTGMTSPDVSQITFPALSLPNPALPITISLKRTDINKVYLLSPDFPGLYDIPFTTASGTTTCNLPNAFARYMIVYFNYGDVNAVKNLAQKPVYTGQPVFSSSMVSPHPVFDPLFAKRNGDSTFYLEASAPGGTVSYSSSNPSVATISGGYNVSVIGNGTTVITASQAGNSNYNAATNLCQTLAATRPVGWWKLDETGSTVTASDSSGYGHNGTLYNANPPQWTAGIVGGGALAFDGGNDYIIANGVAVNTTPGGKNTVAFWMKWNGISNTMPFAWGSAGYDLYFYSGKFGVNTGNGDILGIPSAGLANTWVHVAVVFPNAVPSQANTKIYINGMAQTLTGSGAANNPTATSQVYLSGWGNGGNYWFGGTLDDVRIYNQELSASEIAVLATAPY